MMAAISLKPAADPAVEAQEQESPLQRKQPQTPLAIRIIIKNTEIERRLAAPMEGPFRGLPRCRGA